MQGKEAGFKRLVKLLRSPEVPLAMLVGMAMTALLAGALVHRHERLHDGTAEITPITVFPDFASIPEVSVKKQMFFDFMEQYIVAQNQQVSEIRQRLLAIADLTSEGVALSREQSNTLQVIAERYALDTSGMADSAVMEELLRRVDTIPVSLALAQAANESAWGTSRFALEGNNLFGQWCYDEGCGLVPNRRRADASHEVQAFESIDAAVRAYFMNLNTHDRYEDFRTLRYQMRTQQGELDPLALAYRLDGYSERGEAYVDEVQTIIQQNDLTLKDRS